VGEELLHRRRAEGAREAAAEGDAVGERQSGAQRAGEVGEAARNTRAEALLLAVAGIDGVVVDPGTELQAGAPFHGDVAAQGQLLEEEDADAAAVRRRRERLLAGRLVLLEQRLCAQR